MISGHVKGESMVRKLYIMILFTVLIAILISISMLSVWVSPKGLGRSVANIPLNPVGICSPDNVEIIVNYSIPKDLPDKMPLLKVIPEPIPIGKWLKIARELFNMTGKLEVRYVKDLEWLHIRGEYSDLIIHYGGGFSWHYRNPEYTSQLPTFKKAKRLADSLLNKIKE